MKGKYDLKCFFLLITCLFLPDCSFGALSAGPDRILAAYTFANADAALLSDLLGMPMEGTLSGDFMLYGTKDQPQALMNFTSEALKCNGFCMNDITLEIDGRWGDGYCEGTLAASMSSKGQAFNVKTHFKHLLHDLLSLTNLEVSGRNTPPIKANINLLLRTGLVEGKIEGFANDLSILNDITGGAFEGSSHYELVFRNLNDSQSIEGRISLQKLNVASASVKDLTLSFDLKDVYENPHGKIKLSLDTLASDTLNLQLLTLETSFDSSLPDCPYTLTARRSGVQPMEFFSLGRWSASPTGLRLSMTACHLKSQEHFLEMLKPVDVVLDHAGLHLTPLFVAFGEGSLMLSGDLPVSFASMPSMFQINPAGNFHCKIEGSGQIAPLVHLFVSNTISVTGFAKLAFEAGGTLQAPRISGNGTVENATFESLNTGAVFNHVSASFIGDHDKIILRELQGFDSLDGTISGTGVFGLRDLNPIFNIDLMLKHALMVNLDYAHSAMSGSMALTGNLQGASLAGDLSLDSLQIKLPESSPSSVHDIHVTYINQPQNERPPSQIPTARSNWPIKLDLHLNNDRSATITDSDLTSKWFGNITLSGSTEHPLVNGEFRVLEGSYLFNGKLFKINQGLISFAGPPDKKTSIYVIASADIGDIIAEVILKGPLKNPSIAFRSNPPLSQREILSWILFGHGLSEITPFQGSELGKSIANLNKGSKETDLLTKLRKSIGIDRIDISKGEHNELNDVSLQVGKYISRGVFVSLNKSITADASSLAIEANLLQNFKLQAEVGDDAQGKFHLRWKKDY